MPLAQVLIQGHNCRLKLAQGSLAEAFPEESAKDAKHFPRGTGSVWPVTCRAVPPGDVQSVIGGARVKFAKPGDDSQPDLDSRTDINETHQ